MLTFDPGTGLDLEEVASRIRGPRGTSVILGLVRDGTPPPLEIVVVRDTIKVESVQSHLLPGDVQGGQALRQALPIQSREVNFRHVEPAGMFGGVMDFKAPTDPPR